MRGLKNGNPSQGSVNSQKSNDIFEFDLFQLFDFEFKQISTIDQADTN